MSYASVYQRSLTDPEGFWREQAEALPWFEPQKQVLSQDGNGDWRWFAGGVTNTCYLALDRHVEAGRGEETELIYDSPVTGQVRSYSFAELTDSVGDHWVPACGGTERPTRTRTGRTLLYMWNTTQGEHAYYDCERDIFLTDDEARAALALD